jgi:hypothetical protein
MVRKEKIESDKKVLMAERDKKRNQPPARSLRERMIKVLREGQSE